MKTYWQYFKRDLFGWPCLFMGGLWIAAAVYGFRTGREEAPIGLVVGILLVILSPVSYLWRKAKIKRANDIYPPKNIP